MRILCVHQASELYGSDRSFLSAVETLRTLYPKAEIDVVLPHPGPLVERLQTFANKIQFKSLFVVRRNRFCAILISAPIAYPIACIRAYLLMARYDVLYVNTSVILDYLAAARWHPRAIVHVREIPAPIALVVIRLFLRFSRAFAIYNSKATQAAFALKVGHESRVIHNGVAGPLDPSVSSFRPGGKLNLLLIGRINSWKGQDLLIKAVSLLEPRYRQQIKVRIVGGTFEKNVRLESALLAQIAAAQLQDVVVIEPFVDDVSEAYQWADVVAVPSKRPEPFGRIAIEAMAYMRPVMAAAHGGLTEIVEHGCSGWLIPPNDASAISKAIGEILDGKFDLRTMGRKARRRYLAAFTESAIAAKFANTFAGRAGDQLQHQFEGDDGAARAAASDSAFRVLCVHQSSELYGSDRSFLDSIRALQLAYPGSVIDVILPKPGPLVAKLPRGINSVRFMPLFVLRRRHLWWNVLMGPIMFPVAYLKARRTISGYDLVYINTSVILDYVVAARSHSKAVIHVHEIPTAIVLFSLRLLLRFSGASLIYNSFATQKAFGRVGGLREQVIYNGVDGPDAPTLPGFRAGKKLKLLLIGRINDWKGQDLLIKALSLLDLESRNHVELRILGGTFDNNVRVERALRSQIRAAELQHIVSIEPFDENPFASYEWADVVVVPSKRPEPFGRIAIEGMAHMRPIIAAAHGGLVEIVIHGSSGWLIPPNDPVVLADTIADIIAGKYDLDFMALKARQRYLDCFTALPIVMQTSKFFKETCATAN